MNKTNFKAIAKIFLLATTCGGLTINAKANERHDPHNPDFPVLALPGISRGEAAIANLAGHLPAIALSYGHEPDELRGLLQSDHTLHVDETGHLLYIEDVVLPEGAGEVQGETVTAAAAPFPLADTFALHSRLGAQRVIYLDFDGHVLTGTAWNSSTASTINCPPWDMDGIASSFSDTERTRIQGIWQRVAEDYRPFNVDVTTQYPGEAAMSRSDLNDQVYGVRVLISAISSYFGNYGGIAYVGVFDYTSETYKPALVFPENLSNSEKFIAEAISHEAGHTLGLSHDGTTTGSAYYQGSGAGETGWAPIMGVGYYQNLTQWSRGEYANANNKEDDQVVMQNNGISYRLDDHGNTSVSATPLPSGTILNASGVIERNTDSDYFAFVTGAGTISLTVRAAVNAPNLDVLAELYNSSGAKLATGNTLNALSATTITTSVSAGTYYLSVRGTGQGDPLTGYSSYASLGEYTVAGNVIATGGNQPPIAQATASPGSGYAPLTVQFTGSGSSDPEGVISSYAWNFGDGGTSASVNPSHQYLKAGVFTVTLTVRDAGGLAATASLNVTVNNKPPIASFSASSTSGPAPLTVNFSSTSSDPDGSIASYLWNFGDGSTATSSSAQRQYVNGGIFQVTLKVTDNLGMSSTSSPITITVTGSTLSMSVASILIGNQPLSGVWSAATASVKIVYSGTTNPVQGATVTGRWSGAVTGSASAVTASNGIAYFESPRFKKGGTATFEVTGVSKAGVNYSAAGNTVTKAP